MIFYFTLFTVLGLFSILEVFFFKKNKNSWVFIFFSGLFWILSFIRWENGADWSLYYSFFNESNCWLIDSTFEWGFARINEFVKIYFDNFTVLLFILGAILFLFQTKAILYFSPYPVTSLFLLWSVSLGNIFFVRQTIATAILFYSIRFIQEKKIIPFLLLIALAMLFHRSSLVFIFAWWLYYLKLKPMLFFSILLFCPIGGYFFSNFIANHLREMDGVLGVVGNKLTYYVTHRNETFGMKAPLREIFVRSFVNKIVILSLFVLPFKKVLENNDKLRGLINIYWGGALISLSMIFISFAFVRFSFAYDIVLIIVIPFLILNFTKLNERIYLYIFFFIYAALKLYILITRTYFDLFIPFNTI